MTPSRSSATAAHVAPLGVFMALNFIPGWFRIENPELPWYQQAPEHWLYPVQTVLCGILLWVYRRHYSFRPWASWPLAVGMGIAGFVLWMLLGLGEYHLLELAKGGLPGAGWLSFFDRQKGFNPELFAGTPSWQGPVVALRFIRMAVLVPLIEEIFWRGFLMRYLVADGGSWQKVPFGTHRWSVFCIVTLLVMLAHQPADYAGALVWGALVYWVAVRTRSLAACVLMHAVCNLLLGIYVMRTQSWGFW